MKIKKRKRKGKGIGRQDEKDGLEPVPRRLTGTDPNVLSRRGEGEGEKHTEEENVHGRRQMANGWRPPLSPLLIYLAYDSRVRASTTLSPSLSLSFRNGFAFCFVCFIFPAVHLLFLSAVRERLLRKPSRAAAPLSWPFVSQYSR